MVIDRAVVRRQTRSRLADSVEAALDLGRGVVHVVRVGDEGDEASWPVDRYSQHRSCDGCGRSFEELSPNHFSFNAPLGWCPVCEGLGVQQGADPALLIPDPARSLRAGAVVAWPDFAANPAFARMIEALGKGAGDQPRHPVRRPRRATPARHPPGGGRGLVQSPRRRRPARFLLPVQGALPGDRGGGAGLVRLPPQVRRDGRRGRLLVVHGVAPPRRLRRRPVPRQHDRPGQPLAARPDPELLRRPRPDRRREAHRRRPRPRDPRPPPVPRRRRARLPEPRPRDADAFGRRIPADSPGQPDRQRPDRRPLRPRRADDRPPPARQYPAAQRPPPAPRPGQYPGPGRARPRGDRGRRPPRRLRPRVGRLRRRGHGGGGPRPGRKVGGIAHRALSQRPGGDPRAHQPPEPDAGADHDPRGPAPQPQGRRRRLPDRPGHGRHRGLGVGQELARPGHLVEGRRAEAPPRPARPGPARPRSPGSTWSTR